MTIAILHLSDIHIATKSNPVLTNADRIAETLNQFLPELSAVAIAVTGDIAQSGKKEEYEIARNFINRIISSIKHQKEVQIQVYLSPGNHDCDFDGDQEARLAVINNVANKVGAIPASYITEGTRVQENFMKFREEYENPAPIFSDQLWTTYSLETDGKTILFDALNASWMSTRKEQQGGLLFPFERYTSFKATDCDLRISILHHPLNWFNQSNYLAFRSFLHRLSDITLSGHEHQGNARETDDATDGICTFIEGGELQSRSSLRSSFNIVLIDLKERRFQYKRYSLDNGTYSSNDAVQWTTYRAIPRRDNSEWDISTDFRSQLNDPGATLKHPSGRKLVLSDIYVYPDLDTRSQEKKLEKQPSDRRMVNARMLTGASTINGTILLEGEDSAGKTRLLYRLFAEYHEQGYFPLFIQGEQVRSASRDELKQTINHAIKIQYGEAKIDRYWLHDKRHRLLLLDDLDRSPLNPAGKSRATITLSEYFIGTIVTVGEHYEIEEIIVGNDVSATSNAQKFKISPLGHERRVELIKKWNSIGQDDTSSRDDLLNACDEAERLIESTRLQYVASTVPIFILSLLQAMHSGAIKRIENSSFSHYYHYLVVGALESIGIAGDGINPFIASCTHLSWYIKKFGDDQRITRRQFDEHIRDYSEEWTDTNADELLSALIKSRLLAQEGDAIYFTYPYSYYYFLGRYTNIQIKEDDVRSYLQFCMDNLDVRECANTLVFLAHHSGNSLVLDQIVKALSGLFSEAAVARLDKPDLEKIAGLLACSPKLKYRETQPEQYRFQRARYKDDHDDGEDGLLDRPRERHSKNEVFRDVVSLMKGIEITGALLTHQFSNYPKVKKKAAIKAIFDSSLRAIRMLYGFFEEDPDELIRIVSQRVRGNRQDLSLEQAEMETRHAIGFLLRMIATSFIKKAGAHINSKYLSKQIEEIVTENPTSAYRLIWLGQALQTPRRLPRLELNRLINEQHENPCVMGVLQLFILERMYLFNTSFDDKDWALDVFKLKDRQTIGIGLKHNRYFRKRP